VREGFIASPGTCLLAVDYSQIELRLVAHMAKDEAMLEAFARGRTFMLLPPPQSSEFPG